MKVTITDEMRGKYGKDGAIVAWPEVDVAGRPYDKKDATQQRIDGGTFIVIPPGRSELIEFDDPALHAKYAVDTERVSPSGIVTSAKTMQPIKLATTPNAVTTPDGVTVSEPTADLPADPNGRRKSDKA